MALTVTVTRTDKGLLYDVNKALSCVTASRCRLVSVMPISKTINIHLGDSLGQVIITPDPRVFDKDDLEFNLTLPI